MEIDFLTIADIIGTASFAMTGFLIAIYYRFDLLGIFISATMTALGGGIIRDTILSRTPFAFSNSYPFLVIIVTLLIVIFLKTHKIKNIENNIYYVISDSIGLVAFSVTGALLAIEYNYNLLGVIILSLLTALGGGSLRDIMTNKIPFFFEKDFYAMISVIIATVLYVISLFYKLDNIIISSVFLFALILRFIAYKQKWFIAKLKI